MKHIITGFNIYDKDKDNKPYKTQKGDSFKRVVIRVDKNEADPKEYDDKSISCVSFHDTDPFLSWQIGDSVNILIEEKNGFWNFRSPSRLDLLESRVKILEDFMKNGGVKDEIPDNKDLEEELPDLEEENPDLIPF